MSEYARNLIADLSLKDPSPEARTIEYMVDQMLTAHDRITTAAVAIRSRLTTVDARFSEGDLATVHLNGLGELQALGPAYDAAVAAFEATRAQLVMFTARLAGEQVKPGTYADTARQDAATGITIKSAQARPSGPTLYVRNAEQKVLWDEELAGQISDGQWENARPHDHWKVWCDATVVVRPEAVGRTFYARRSSYDFTNGEFLGIVGDRMMEAVTAATGRPYHRHDLLRDLRDLKAIIKTQTSHEPA